MLKNAALLLVLALAGCNATPEELAAMGQSLQGVGSSYAQGAQANLYNASMYRAPMVQSYAPPPNAILNCFKTGNIVHCP